MIKYTILILLLTGQLFFCHAQDTLRKKWFDFALHSALVVNNSISNVSYSELVAPNPVTTRKISSISDAPPVSFGFSAGIDLLLGRSEKVQHVIYLSFDNTNSRFNYYSYSSSKPSPGGSSGWSSVTDLDIARNAKFLIAGYGWAFKIKERIGLGVLICYNSLLYLTDIQTIRLNGATSASPQTVITHSTINTNPDFWSARLRLGYHFKIKKQRFQAFALHNINFVNYLDPTLTYKAPWWQAGLQYFPVRK